MGTAFSVARICLRLGREREQSLRKKSVDPPFVLIDQAAKKKKCLIITEINGKRKENEYSGWMGMYDG